MSDTRSSDFFYDSADGLRLHARLYGRANLELLPVICLPGLTRNARDFHRLAEILSEGAQTPRRVIAFDYRGRGRSAYDPNWQNYTVGAELADILLALSMLGITRAHFIGTSRGGLIVQVLAGIQPAVIASAVLNDIGPVIERNGLDQIRRYLSNSICLRSVEQAVEWLKEVHGPGFPALADEDWAAMAAAIYRLDDGVPVADYDPQLVRTLMPTDPEQPAPEFWKEFEALSRRPVLAIRGANSSLLSATTLEKMAGCSPNVETITVFGQGHAPLLETGDLPRQISAFLDGAERA